MIRNLAAWTELTSPLGAVVRFVSINRTYDGTAVQILVRDRDANQVELELPNDTFADLLRRLNGVFARDRIVATPGPNRT